MSESKGVESKIRDLDKAANFKEMIAKQQEIFLLLLKQQEKMAAELDQIKSYVVLNDTSDLHELYRTDAHDHIKESVQAEGRGYGRSSNQRGGR